MSRAGQSGAGSRVVILGAGLGGLSAGWALRKQGYSVTLLEKEPFNGGLAITKQSEGFRYDLGPHNIHTVHEHVLTLLSRRFRTLFKHLPTYKILRRGRFYAYPVRGLVILTSLPWWKVVPAVANFVGVRCLRYLAPASGDRSFKQWIVRRFGRILYREYFHDYPIKAWGLSTDRIHRYVAEKRIPIVGLLELIRAVFRKPPQRLHPEFSDMNFYMKNGIGELPESFEKELLSLGGEIRNEVRITGISTGEGRVHAVHYDDGDGVSHEIACEFLLSTIPINQLIPLLESVPEPVRDAAQKLRYRATRLFYLKVGKKLTLPAKMHFFPQPETWFSRMSDVGAFSEEMVPPGKSLLCFEFPCHTSDPVWSCGDDELTEHVVPVLERQELLDREDIEGSFSEQVSHSYPMFEVGYHEWLHTCQDHLAQFGNVVSFGRQGCFAYINTDTVIHQALGAATAVILAPSVGFSCAEWFQTQIRGKHSK